MSRQAGTALSNVQRKQLVRFMNETKDKREYRAALGVLLRGDGKSAKEVGRQLGATIKQVFEWCHDFRAGGTDGLRMKKQTGRPAIQGNRAKKVIPELLKKDPQAFGYLKGRWVLRDISRELKKEGIDLHYTSVHRVLGDLGIALKSPKLRAPGSIRKNYRKRAEIRGYKRIAGALLKKGSP
ncbi:MAG: helix-turn-helix domain-containing protein [Candidatus Zixiibacteriota bacterium]